jgi:hypothetical protein
VLLVLGALSACVIEPEVLSPTTEPPQAISTSATQTVAAELTLSAGGTAVAQLTEVSRPTTATVEEPTSPPILAPTAPATTTPIPTSAPPSATSTPLSCDSASFLGDVTIEPYTTFEPGERFLKIWRISNTSDCTWTQNYSLVFTGGNSMSGPLKVSLPKSVDPGDSVDIGIGLTAPQDPGDYQGYWLLLDPSNNMIEVIPNPLGGLWVQIRVEKPASLEELDFADQYCSAVWRSGNGRLGCPGNRNDTNGSVILLDAPRLESGIEDEPALWMRPNQGRGGWISGEYSPFRVSEGDRFIAEIGCLRDSPGCELLFELDYRLTDGYIGVLDSWYQSYDGHTTAIDIDLENLVGEAVQFVLRVTNRGKYRDANAFWLVPHIHNGIGQRNLVISWRQEGGPSKICYDVKIYQTGRHTAEARARTCGSGVRDSARVDLDDNDADRVLGWVDRFKSYEFEVDTPTSGEALKETITFSGVGDKDASSNDINTMREFMLNLYYSIIF